MATLAKVLASVVVVAAGLATALVSSGWRPWAQAPRVPEAGFQAAADIPVPPGCRLLRRLDRPGPAREEMLLFEGESGAGDAAAEWARLMAGRGWRAEPLPGGGERRAGEPAVLLLRRPGQECLAGFLREDGRLQATVLMRRPVAGHKQGGSP